MQFHNQTNFYKGKVRDVYTIKDEYLVMIASNRISAFDVILPHPIPYKGQVLNQIASYFLKATADIVPNWVIDVPLPNITIGKKCEPYPVEMVIRGNLTGHAWRTYKKGLRTLCGVQLPEGMKENDFFPTPIITPTTKAHVGHDEDISREEILKRNLITEEEYSQLEKYTYALFERGKQMALKQGLILADTKYEFGKIENTITLIDEIHTPDSSRYFYANAFDENQKKGIAQKQLSKEFVREWLIANNFMGLDGQKIPEMNDDFISQISERYIELFEKITGSSFVKEVELSDSDIEQIINQRLQLLS